MLFSNTPPTYNKYASACDTKSSLRFHLNDEFCTSLIGLKDDKYWKAIYIITFRVIGFIIIIEVTDITNLKRVNAVYCRGWLKLSSWGWTIKWVQMFLKASIEKKALVYNVGSTWQSIMIARAYVHRYRIDCQAKQLQVCKSSLTMYFLSVSIEMTSNLDAVKGINRYLYEWSFCTSWIVHATDWTRIYKWSLSICRRSVNYPINLITNPLKHCKHEHVLCN